ncbi:MAG: helix-turn-helix domain-containing protein [Crocinitomicaceae bacterium]
MATNIITPDDLEQFKWELLADIKEYLDKKEGATQVQKEEEWIKSHQVQRLLGISPGTLQNLRVNGTIPYSKVGGVLFYKKVDIQNILEQNMRNRNQSITNQ